MMKSIKLNFQTKMYLYNAVTVLVVISLLILFFNYYVSGVLTQNAIKNLEDSAGKILTGLERSVGEMDTLTAQVQYNTDIQDILFNAGRSGTSTNYFLDNIEDKLKVQDILLSINSTRELARRICVFNGKHNFVAIGSSGSAEVDSQTDFRELPYIKNLSVNSSSAYLVPPHTDNWTTQQRYKTLVVSYIRSLVYTIGNNNLIGYVEVLQPYSEIEEICKASSEDLKIFVFNDKSELIFPYKKYPAEVTKRYLEEAQKYKGKNYFWTDENTFGQKELVFSEYSSTAKLTVVQAIPQREFLSPIHIIERLLLISGLVIIVLTLFLEFMIVRSLTAPIRSLRKTLQQVSMNNIPIVSRYSDENNEVEQLKSAFEDTLIRLQDSMEDIIKLKASESHAHLMALQSQMNPHFLYNSLMGIYAVAQKEKNRDIMSMCTQLSSMLRYVASYSEKSVTLREEMAHAENYLRLQKWRYEDTFKYQIDIPDTMVGIAAPKLIIQPLLENSFNHGFKCVPPPWEIKIKGTFNENQWFISVWDNGVGFTQDKIADIFERAIVYEKDVVDGKLIESLGIGGLGLMNIFVRLKLLYKDSTVMKIENCKDLGCKITLGGIIQ